MFKLNKLVLTLARLSKGADSIIYRTCMEQRPSSPETVIISVEGNIGSGKSTLLRVINTRFRNIHTIPEPIEEWTKLDGGINPLQAMYLNSSYSAVFQMLTIHSHIKMLKEAKLCEKDCILERCWESNKDIFTKLLLERREIDSVENAIYEHILKDRLMEIDYLKPDGYVYLETSVETCTENIAKRRRTCESGITKEHLIDIERKHELFIRKQEACSVLTINNVCGNDYEVTLTKIKRFIDTLRGRK